MTANPSSSYESIPALSSLYLEDSFVLGITTEEHLVEFHIDLVLTPSHAEYHEPRPGERYCYRRGRIRITEPKTVRWLRHSMRPSLDANDEIDYGAIDAWSIDGEWSSIEGDWGELEILGGTVSVLLDDELDDDGRDP